jgi:hypothetical protein
MCHSIRLLDLRKAHSLIPLSTSQVFVNNISMAMRFGFFVIRNKLLFVFRFKVPALNIDLAVLCVEDGEQMFDLLTMLYNHRHSPSKCGHTLASTHDSVIRTCVQFEMPQRATQLLLDTVRAICIHVMHSTIYRLITAYFPTAMHLMFCSAIVYTKMI